MQDQSQELRVKMCQVKLAMCKCIDQHRKENEMSLIIHAVGFRRQRMNDKSVEKENRHQKRMKEGQWMTDLRG